MPSLASVLLVSFVGSVNVQRRTKFVLKNEKSLMDPHCIVTAAFKKPKRLPFYMG